MTPRGPWPGDIYIAVFPEQDPHGREQEGLRPALVLMVPVKPRFPVLLAVPMTTDRGQPWVKASPDLYIRLAQGTGGLPSDSILLLDQARSLDATRVRRFLGTLDKETFNGVLGKWTALFKRG